MLNSLAIDLLVLGRCKFSYKHLHSSLKNMDSNRFFISKLIMEYNPTTSFNLLWRMK